MADGRELNGTVALVTGAGRGLGLALAQALGAAGARLFITARQQESLSAAQQMLREQGIEVHGALADVTLPGSAKETIAQASQAYGCVDVLVNNAAQYGWRGFLELSEADWNTTLATNLTAPFVWTQAFARQVIGQGSGGAVVNIGSVHGVMADARAVAQCASKSGLHALTKSAAEALRPHGIRVNAVAPGAILADSGAVHAQGPQGQVTQADVAQMVVFLASPAARSVTGAVLEAFGATHTALIEA